MTDKQKPIWPLVVKGIALLSLLVSQICILQDRIYHRGYMAGYRAALDQIYHPKP